MAKRLELTESIKAAIRKQTGDEDFDFSKIAVFEAEVASTRPITQSYSAYDGARLSQNYLQQMADYLEQETVPLQVMHNSQFLPVGKVVKADLFDSENGEQSLNALFYVKDDSEHAENIELGLVDEVSIGATPAHALCSECGYDYVTEDDGMGFWLRECDEGHQLGQNGVHLRVTSLSQWKELSLVNKGASSKPKILGSAKQRLSKQEFTKLAASSGSPMAAQMSYLSCTPTTLSTHDNKGKTMELSDQVIKLSSDKARLEVKTENLEAQLTASQTALTDANTKVEELEQKLAALEPSKETEKLASLEASLEEANKGVSFLAAQYKVACAAAGIEFKEDASVSDMTQALEEAQVKLAAIPRNGATLEASSGKDDNSFNYHANLAFVNG